MRICDLSSGVGQLTQALADLKERLAEINTQWNDATRQAFDQTHLAELPLRLQQTMGAAQRLADVLHKAERECGDHAEDGQF